MPLTEISTHALDNIYADMLIRSGMTYNTPAEFADFLEAMGEAHDRVKAHLAVDSLALDDLRTRLLVQLRDEKSMADLAADYGGLDIVLGGLLWNNAASVMHGWDEREWAEIEDIMFDQEPKRGWGRLTLSKACCITLAQAGTLMAWYGLNTAQGAGGKLAS